MSRLLNGAHRSCALIACLVPLVSAAVGDLLEKAGFEVLRCEPAELIDAVRTRAPALAVLDCGDVALDLLRDGRVADGATRFILFIPDGDGAAASHAVELGVDGLLRRSAPVAAVAECIASVAAGGQWLDPVAMHAAYDRIASPTAASPLTKREQDVARLVAEGQRNRLIATTLGISEGTVKMHLHNVYAKLGLESRTQLAMDVRLRALN